MSKRTLIKSPWFSDRTQKLSHIFPLPTKLSRVKIDSRNSLSWPNVKILKNKQQQTTSSKPSFQPFDETTDVVDSRDKIIKKWKIRLKPSSQQKECIIQHWFGLHRFLFNQTLKKYSEKIQELTDNEILQSIESTSNLDNRDFPSSSKLEAVREALFLLNKNPQYSKLKARNDCVQHFYIPSNIFGWDESNFYISTNDQQQQSFEYFQPYNKREFEKMKTIITTGIDSRVTFQYERPGRYYLLIAYIMQITSKLNNDEKRIVALDPGIKVFQTCYDNEGVFLDYGKGATARFLNLEQKKLKFYQNNQKKKAGFIQLKINDLRRDMHWKIIHYFQTHYTDVLLPEFSSLEIERSGNLSNTSISAMKQLDHDLFRKRMLQKAHEIGKEIFRVHIVSEKYTSKTCGRCGYLFHDLGGSRMFTCYHCGNSFDRDRQAARNIFLMNVEKCCGMV